MLYNIVVVEYISGIESTTNIIIDTVSGMHFNPLMSKYSQWFNYLFHNKNFRVIYLPLGRV